MKMPNITEGDENEMVENTRNRELLTCKEKYNSSITA